MDSSEASGPELLFGHLWDYSPAAESPDSVAVADRYGHFINGKFVEGENHFPCVNPATGETLFEAASADRKMVNRAVKAARIAYERHWQGLRPVERGKYLYRIGRLIQERAGELSLLETLDSGRPIRESRSFGLPLVAAHFLHHAGWADKIEYAFPGKTASSLGVVAGVVPGDFPLLRAAWKIAPALAAGNTVVLKASEAAPLVVMGLAGIFEEANLPPGVVNILNGAEETGRILTTHRDADLVAFTGSAESGKQVRRSLAGTGKRLTLELGSKGIHILFEDAALDQAVDAVAAGVFPGSRLLVQESILASVVQKLKVRMATLRVGDPLDANTDVGPLSSREHLDRTGALVEAACDEGATLHQADCALPERGYYFRPAFVTEVAQASPVAREEIPGPVLTLLTFRTPAEAVARANNTCHGLTAGIWSNKGSRVLEVADQLRAGVVWGNTVDRFDPLSPFGGYRESGSGREGGLHGIRSCLEVR